MAELVVHQDVSAPARAVWQALTDWSLHDRWMLFTRATGGEGEGASIEAVTGFGRLAIRDTMTIVVWEPPHRCVVRHTGRLVRGSGSFEVRELDAGRARIIWSEWLDLPFGRVGQFGWPLVRPVARAGIRVSLRRLARYLEGRA